MRDLKNMAKVNEQIKSDKHITLAVSIVGALFGAGCFVWAIDVLLG